MTKQQPKEPAGPPPGYKVKEVQQPAGPPPGWTDSAIRPTALAGPPPKKMPKGRGRGRGKSAPPPKTETGEPMLRPKSSMAQPKPMDKGDQPTAQDDVSATMPPGNGPKG